MEILFVSSEVEPFARAGGLADVSCHLPKALAGLGHTVYVVTPKYRESDEVKKLVKTDKTISVPIALRNEKAEIFASDISGLVKVYLIGKDDFYDREGLYGNAYGDYEDNAERFIFYCRAVVELILALGLSPDVIHCNDWQTGLVPVYLRTIYQDAKPLSDAATVFTVHNLGNQGVFWVYDYSMTGLGWELFNPESLEFYGSLNLMKGGLLFSDIITTVSNKYAQEILTPEYGFGLEGVLAKRKEDLFSVLNGVDYEEWDPQTDKYIAAAYGPDNLDPKAACKKDLKKRFGLDESADQPIAAIISRLVDRKGLDLVSTVFEDMLNLNLQFVIMGKGEDKYHSFFKEMTSKHPGKVGLSIAYDHEMAHRIEAGADLFLMPSRYEPCGLDQLYSLRYGTIPVVRATGGLDDTVVDYDDQGGKGTGFKFSDYTPESLFEVVKRAVGVYSRKQEWNTLASAAMRCEFSWERAAQEYVSLYQKAIAKRKGQ